MRHSSTMLSVLALTLLLPPLAVAAEAPPPLSCSMVALTPRVLPGEWFLVRFVVRNVDGSTVRVAGVDQWGLHKVRSRGVGEEWRDWGGWPPDGTPSGDPPFAKLEPGELIEKVHLLRPSWLHSPPGKYEVQLLIDYPRWPSFTKPPAGAWAGVVECTPAQMEVVAPMGVDAQAFEALGPFPLSADGWEILRSFPTSRYAGYVLLGTFGGIDGSPDSILWKRDNTRERIRSGPVYVRRDLEAQAAKYDKEAALLLSAVQSFLGAHPDFPLRSRLRLKQAGLLAYFDRYEEARALAKLGLAEEEDRIWKRDGQRLLDLMVEKGYLKPE